MKTAPQAVPARPRGRQKETRLCDTRFKDSFCLHQSGVDSVSYALRPQCDEGHQAISRFRSRSEFLNFETGEYHRTTNGPSGSVLIDKPVNGMRLGCFPGTALIFAEGRLGAMLARSGDEHRLMNACLLPTGESRFHEALRLLGFELEPELARVRRLDLAAELRFTKTADGTSFMRALASLDVPGLKRDVWIGKGGVIETVYFRTPKRGQVRLRVYRKDLEAKIKGQGVIVRVERQVRYSKAQQQTSERVSGSDLSALFEGRLEVLARGSGSVVVSNLSGAQEMILKRCEEQAISPRKAERMLGTLTLLDHFGREWWDKAYTVARRERELQDLGIVLDTERQEREPVPVGELLTLLVESFRDTEASEAERLTGGGGK